MAIYIKDIARLIRINNWLKNIFVFFPLIFSLNLLNIPLVISSVIACFSFCLTSSVIYIINDITDLNKDKIHPRKKERPLASGRISKNKAIFVIVTCLVIVLLLLTQLKKQFIGYIVIYFVINVLYSIWLKKINLIESFIISSNFLIRVLAGCAAISVVPSEWIIVVTFFISLFLIFIKRKSEIKMLGEKAIEHRSVLKYYNIGLLDKYIYITATITIASYMLYTVNEEIEQFFGTTRLMYTTVFVILGIFRFIQLSDINNYDDEGDPTSLIIKDKFIQLVILGWFLTTIFILYIL